MDRQFPPEKQKVVDELLGNGKYAPGYERTYWEGCVHGFAVRGDMVRLAQVGSIGYLMPWIVPRAIRR